MYFLCSDAANHVHDQERVAVGAGPGRAHEEAEQGREDAVHYTQERIHAASRLYKLFALLGYR